MSRSKKKPVIKLKNNSFFKKHFNRKLRRKNISLHGADYKKYNCTWDICDFNTGILTGGELKNYEKFRLTMK